MLAGVFLFLILTGSVFVQQANAGFTSESRFSDTIAAAKQEARQKQLAQQKAWQHLVFSKQSALFYNRPEVISGEFYLSPTKHFDAQAELLATLDLLNNDKKAFCRFPARLFWLSHQLTSLSFYAIKQQVSRCNDLPIANQDVSLIQVSGYLKNPASTFGHALVNVDAATGNRLINESFNFGARVPPNENSMVYAFKGLFGVYDAGFARADFFKNDAIYSKNEQRDMWEYVLDLDDNQKTLLNYHLFELRKARFDYYFLKQNCGYRTGELLELVTDISITNRITPWYAPDYIFHQMLEHRLPSGKPLVKHIRFIPSEQSQVYHRFDQFPSHIQRSINQSIARKDISLIEHLPVQTKAKVLDFLIQYANYKLAGDKNKSGDDYRKSVVRARFALPAVAQNQHISTHLPNKTTHIYGPKPSRISMTLTDAGQYVGLTLFDRDLLNSHTTLDAEFKMIDLVVGHHAGEANLVKADFIKLLKIEDIGQPLVGEQNMSWQLKLGMQMDPYAEKRIRQDDALHYINVSAGVGRQFSSYISAYSLIGIEVNDSQSKLDGIVTSAITYKKDKVAVQLENQLRKRASQDVYSKTQLMLKTALSKNTDMRVFINDDEAGATLSYFF